MFISGLPLNGWARQPFIAEGFGAGGDLFADYILFVSSPLFLFFQRTFSLPQQRREALLSRKLSSVRGRGAVASRPWGERVLGAGRSNRGRGAMKIKEEETTFLLKRTTFKEKKTGVVFGRFCWKWVARGDNFAGEIKKYFMPTNYFIASKRFLFAHELHEFTLISFNG